MIKNFKIQVIKCVLNSLRSTNCDIESSEITKSTIKDGSGHPVPNVPEGLATLARQPARAQ